MRLLLMLQDWKCTWWYRTRYDGAQSATKISNSFLLIFVCFDKCVFSFVHDVRSVCRTTFLFFFALFPISHFMFRCERDVRKKTFAICKALDILTQNKIECKIQIVAANDTYLTHSLTLHRAKFILFFFVL